MSLFQNIKKAFTVRLPKTSDTSFVFPYSDDKETRRQQVWDNLQKGILLEDTGIWIPWLAPIDVLDKYAEQKKHRADRTEWFLGRHVVLDGYTCQVGVMKWIFKNSGQFTEIEEWLGPDNEGYQKFLLLKSKLTDLLGNPSKSELTQFGDFELGSIEWTNKNVKIRLSGIEQFACRYRLYIGVGGDSNW